MEKFSGLREGPLNISRKDTSSELVLEFVGKSILRDPSGVLQQGLLQSLEEAEAGDRTLVLDFTGLTYMNSATFTPLIKTLEKARLGSAMVRVLYSSEKRWQTVSFEALKIFATSDGRISLAVG